MRPKTLKSSRGSDTVTDSNLDPAYSNRQWWMVWKKELKLNNRTAETKRSNRSIAWIRTTGPRRHLADPRTKYKRSLCRGELASKLLPIAVWWAQQNTHSEERTDHPLNGLYLTASKSTTPVPRRSTNQKWSPPTGNEIEMVWEYTPSDNAPRPEGIKPWAIKRKRGNGRNSKNGSLH